MDVADLEDLLRDRLPVAEIADFLCRDVREVEAKIAERRRRLCDCDTHDGKASLMGLQAGTAQ
jgi:hypothetical protein